jgi:superfamily II DNA or RNA helicase
MSLYDDDDGPQRDPLREKWLKEIKAYERLSRTWETRSLKIVRRYKNDRKDYGNNIDTVRLYNVLWSNIETLKPAFIADLIESFGDESSIVWCRFNDEQDAIAKIIPGAASIDGGTPEDERREIIRKYQAGEIKCLVSKPKIMGFGLNLHIATRQIFSTCQDSYEEFYQCVKRSNRVGSTKPLNVHIPVSEIERPMVESVLRKAARVQADTEEQEVFFKANRGEGM